MFFLPDLVAHRSCQNNSYNIGNLSDGKIQPTQDKRYPHQRDGTVFIFYHKVFEIIYRSSVTNGIEYQSGNSGTEQYPPRLIVEQVLYIVFQRSFLVVDRFYPFSGPGKASENNKAHIMAITTTAITHPNCWSPNSLLCPLKAFTIGIKSSNAIKLPR